VSVKRDSFSLSFAVGAYGTAFGAASVTAHFSVLQTCLLSLLTFSGASQFAVIGVLGAGGSALSGITTATLLGTRNALYGLRMGEILKVTGLKRIVAAQVTIDESTAIATAQKSEVDQKIGFWHTGFGVYIFWNLFTALGAVGAKAIGNPAAWGLDAAVPAAFIGLVWPRLVDRKSKSIALAAVGLSLALVPFTPSGVPIISTALLAIIVGWRR